MIGFITGSGLYDFPELTSVEVNTRYGKAQILKGEVGGNPVLILPRHGTGHHYLPHQIPHRANIAGLKEAGATSIVSCSVCGILNPAWSPGTPFVANDLLFSDNRLGDGSVCTFFTEPGEKGRGHLLASSFFHKGLSDEIKTEFAKLSGQVEEGCYAHAPGPRFNSVAEVRTMRQAGADFLSQTCGPEAVLANELELPYALAGFGIDYANGVAVEPTSVEELQSNLERSQEVFKSLIRALASRNTDHRFSNFIYRFE